MYGWRSDADTARYLSGVAPESIEQQRAWFERVCDDPSFSYHIVELAGMPIGFTSMFNAEPEKPEAEWGVVIGKRREPGDVQAIAPLCCKCAFAFGGLTALYTSINEENSGAIARVKQMGAELYEASSPYRKNGELLFQIHADDFEKKLHELTESKPALAQALTVEMYDPG